eukprot:2167434-Rhodomonas_salina.1
MVRPYGCKEMVPSISPFTPPSTSTLLHRTTYHYISTILIHMHCHVTALDCPAAMYASDLLFLAVDIEVVLL